MNNTDHTSATTASNAAFDAAMRERYVAASTHVSPYVRWNARAGLARAGRSDAAPGPRWHPGRMLAGAAAAVFAVAIGLGLHTAGHRSNSQPPALAIEQQMPGQDARQADLQDLGPLEQDIQDQDAPDQDVQEPDFYAWLASDEVNSVAADSTGFLP